MEYIAVDKEAYFRKGIRKRIKLISQLRPINDIDAITINFKRNLPFDAKLNAEIFNLLAGRVSNEFLITKYTEVENVKDEIERLKVENEERQKLMLDSFENQAGQNNEDDEIEDEDE